MIAILRTSLLGGLLMAVCYHLADNYHFPIFPAHIVIVPGGMMFSINGFLKSIQNQKKYTYIMGVSISFLYAFLSFMLAYAMFTILYIGSIKDFSITSYWLTATIAIKNNMPLILISSFLIPLMYLGKEGGKSESPADILDQDL